MTILTWAIRLCIISLLVVFSVNNTEPVLLHFLPDRIWQAPLVVVLLVFTAGGVLLGVLSMLGTVYRQRREIVRWKRAAAVDLSEPAHSEKPLIP